MAKTRPTIFGLMLLVLTSALWLASTRGATYLDFVPLIALGSIVLFAAMVLRPFARAVVHLHENRTLSLGADYVPVDPSDPGLPEGASVSIEAVRRDLSPLGFAFRQCLTQIETEGNPRGNVAIFSNEATREVARLTQAFAPPGASRKPSINVILSTEFADGCVVATTDNSFPSVFPPVGPPLHVFKFPDVADVEQLLRWHRALVRRFEGGRIRRDPLGPDPLAYQANWTRRMKQHFLECGYYRVDEDSGVMRPTWKGAILSLAKVTRSGKAIQLAIRRRRAARLIRELERQD